MQFGHDILEVFLLNGSHSRHSINLCKYSGENYVLVEMYFNTLEGPLWGTIQIYQCYIHSDCIKFQVSMLLNCNASLINGWLFSANNCVAYIIF